MKRYNLKKGKRYTFFSVIVIGIVTVMLLSVVYYNSLKQIVDKPFNDFKVLTIKEAFENAFKNVSIQPSGFGIVNITGMDEMNNVYTAKVTKEGLLSISINNENVPNPEELYREIYAKAFYNLILTKPIADYESSDPKNVLNYIRNVSYDYFQENDREYISLIGKDENGNTVQIIYNIAKVDGKLRIVPDKVFVNNKLLNSTEKRIFLAKVYKKSVDRDLIEVVKNSFLKEYPYESIEQVLSKVNNARWTIKDENRKMVEFNGMDNIDNKEVVITIGFRINEDGETVVEYAQLNGQDVEAGDIPYLISYLYSRYSSIDKNRDIERYKQIIFSTKVPNSTKTFGEFFTQYVKNDKWDIQYATNNVKLLVTAETASNDKVYMEFLFTKGGIYLSKAMLNNVEQKFDELTSKIFTAGTIQQTGPVAQTTSPEGVEKIEKIKSGKIVKYSSFANNEEAFKSYLRNLSWSYDAQKDRVVLTGVGKYGTKTWNFKFVFDLYFGREPVLEDMFMDGINVIDEVSDYVISKIFRVDTLGNNIVELVKNTVFTFRTYEEILGPIGWKIDRNNDRVVYTSDNLQINFAVEPAGQVKVVQVLYKGQDWTTRSYEILKTLENGGNLASLEQSPQKTQEAKKEPVKPATEQPVEQPSKPQLEQNQEEIPETQQYGQF